MQRIEVLVNKTNGLHIRMAATLIAKLQSLIQDSSKLRTIYVLYKDKKIPITSLLLVVSLKIQKGDRIVLLFEEEVDPHVLHKIKQFMEGGDQDDSPDEDHTDQLLMENSIATEAVLSSLPNGIVVVNKENVITYCNDEAQKLLELTDEQLLNQRADQVIPHSKLHHVLATGQSEIAQRQEIGKRTILTNRSPILLHGKIVGAVALFQDISSIEELSRQLKEIQSLKEQLDLILHSVEDLIAHSDEQGQIIYANPKMNRLLGKIGQQQSIQGLLGDQVWEKVATSREAANQVIHLEQGLPYIAKINPIIVDDEFYGTVLTMSPLNEWKSLLQQLEIAEERTRYLEQELSKYEVLHDAFSQIIGYSEALMDSLSIAKKVAKTDSTVLITGESGTGKELVAKGIHEASARKGKPFIRVNCAAIPASLIESELFGHEKGAFTGAHQMRAGKFELAHTGTIFLDEIGDLNLDMQAKLLRVLQEREVERVGGSRTIKLDVRVIAATHRDLKKMVMEGSFREDLYYRLNVIPVHLPPLRNRREDIPVLVDYFRKQLNQRQGKSIKYFEKGFMEALMHYNWPGNIRELQNVMERVISLSEGDTLQLKYLPEYLRENQSYPESGAGLLLRDGEVLPMAEYEKEVLKHTIQYFPSYNMAGKALGLTHKTVASKVRKYGLESYLGRKYQQS